MSISEAMEDAMNQQLTHELASAHLYLAMSASCAARGLPGLAMWLRQHAAEEEGHAIRFFNEVQQRGGRVRLGAMDAPPVEFGSARETIAKALQHEREVTAMIKALFHKTQDEEDAASQQFLKMFIDEQAEEERVFGKLLEDIEGSSKEKALMGLDARLARETEAKSPQKEALLTRNTML